MQVNKLSQNRKSLPIENLDGSDKNNLFHYLHWFSCKKRVWKLRCDTYDHPAKPPSGRVL